jgi:hypothetical protein
MLDMYFFFASPLLQFQRFVNNSATATQTPRLNAVSFVLLAYDAGNTVRNKSIWREE